MNRQAIISVGLFLVAVNLQAAPLFIGNAQPSPAKDFWYISGEVELEKNISTSNLWEGEAEIQMGSDFNKLILQAGSEVKNGNTEEGEVRVLYSRYLDKFWTGRLGVKHEFKPVNETYLAFGITGLAPYRIETALTGFLDDNGRLSAELEFSSELYITRSLVMEPYATVNLYSYNQLATDATSWVGSYDFGVQFRHDFSKVFAVYADFKSERFSRDIRQEKALEGDDTALDSLYLGVNVSF